MNAAVFVSVIGDAGLGKTRLVTEFQSALVQGTEVFAARADPHSVLHPYGILRQLFAPRFAGWLLAIPDAQHSHALARLAGLDVPQAPTPTSHDEQRLFRDAIEAAHAVLAHLCDAGQVPLVVVDDVQWADAPSLRFLASLHARCQGVASLFLFPARPSFLDRGEPWPDTGPAHWQIQLAALDEGAQHEMLTGLLCKLEDVPEALRKLLARAGGVPYYIEELVQMLVDDGLLDTSQEPWRVDLARLATARIPPTLTAVLQSRLDALAPAERACIQSASVLGPRFERAALDAVHPGSVAVISALERKRLIVAQADQLMFQHHLLHQAVYASLLKADRMRGHAAVGAWWQAKAQAASPRDVDAARCEAVAEAQHHLCITDATGFIDWFQTQFSNYYHAYAVHALEPLVERLVMLCEDRFGAADARTATWLVNRARVALLRSDTETAEAALTRALTVQEVLLDRNDLELARSYAVMGGCLRARGDFSGSIAYLQKAVSIRELALGIDHPLTLGILDLLAHTLSEVGRMEEAEAYARRAVAGKEGAVPFSAQELALSLCSLADVLCQCDRYQEAEALVRRAMSLQDTVLAADHPDRGYALWFFARSLQGQGRFAAAEQSARDALRLIVPAFGESHEWTAWTLWSLAETCRELGRPAEAREYARRALVVFEKMLGTGHRQTAAVRSFLSGLPATSDSGA